jgi:hypothetical protein
MENMFERHKCVDDEVEPTDSRGEHAKCVVWRGGLSRWCEGMGAVSYEGMGAVSYVIKSIQARCAKNRYSSAWPERTALNRMVRGSNPFAGITLRDVAQRSAREAHNLEVPGSTPGIALKFFHLKKLLLPFKVLTQGTQRVFHFFLQSAGRLSITAL